MNTIHFWEASNDEGCGITPKEGGDWTELNIRRLKSGKRQLPGFPVLLCKALHLRERTSGNDEVLIGPFMLSPAAAATRKTSGALERQPFCKVALRRVRGGGGDKSWEQDVAKCLHGYSMARKCPIHLLLRSEDRHDPKAFLEVEPHLMRHCGRPAGWLLTGLFDTAATPTFSLA
uniref:Uncharacterized protein n=1 Tax=Sphaerodactylus townsendi TaxID=933632 RepID=A0ACB8F123_9SAUR